MGDEKNPPGGLDKTPLKPTSDTAYKVKITFYSASNLPVADLGKRSSDPYVLAQINTDLPQRHDKDPPLRFRSETIRKNTEPTWNAVWVVAGVPEKGFELKTRIYDEDPDDHDDRLGKVYFHTGRLSEGYKKKEEYKVRKSGADLKAYALRSCTAMTKGRDLHGKMVIGIEVLEKCENIGKAYTVNRFYRVHYSPIIGRIAGVKSRGTDGVDRFNFQANEIQLEGPVPNELYHRYVEFKSFVQGMFKGTGFRGRILHKALHHQHERLYNYDGETKYGNLDSAEELTQRFLDMVHYDEGGRIFTYVITLDGLWRFTETGKEFGIDLLSKHTMHSDVNIYIAWSGEFLVRRLKHPEESAEAEDQETHPKANISGGPPDESPPKDPKNYELVIDNDSGTYRPEEKLLPVLQKFLEKNLNLQVVVKSCTDKDLDKIKDDQREAKKKEGEGRVYGQASDAGSISSSDAESLGERGHVERGVGILENPKKALHL